MTRTKNLQRLTLLLCFICFLILGINHSNNEKITANDKEILSISSSEITAISWNTSNSTLSFTKSDETWKSTSDEAFPVNQETMNSLLDSLSSIVSTFKIEGVEDYDQYGLETPKCVIEVTADKTYTISLGNYSDIDEERYAMIDDGNVYLLKTDLFETFDITLDDLIQLESIPEMNTITKYTIKGNQNFTIVYDDTLKYSYSEEYCHFLKEDGYYPIDEDTFESYLKLISDLEWQECMSYNASEAELEECGLNSPNFTITIHYLDEEENSQTFTLALSEKNENYFARINNSSYIYSIDEDTFTAFKEKDEDYLKTKDIIPLDLDVVSKIEFILDESTYTFEVTKDDDGYIYTYEGDEVKLANTINELKNTTIESFVDEEATKKNELTVIIYQNIDGYEKMTINFYQYNGEGCLAYLNDECIGLVTRSDVVDIIEALNSIILG